MPKIGRPTVFKPEYSKELIRFFDIEPNKKELVAKSQAFDKKTGEVTFEKNEYKKVPNKLPTLYRFTKKIGVSIPTFYYWLDKGQELKKRKDKGELLESNEEQFIEFVESYGIAKELYKQFLIVNGLENLYNSAFTIFVAKNTTDMKDKSESEVKVLQIDLVQLLREARDNEPNKKLDSPIYPEPNHIHSGDLELNSSTG